MGIGASLFLIAIGAILAFAVHVTVAGLSIQTVGVILMIVGGIGLIASMVFWSSFSPYRRDRAVYDDGVAAPRRAVVREREVL